MNMKGHGRSAPQQHTQLFAKRRKKLKSQLRMKGDAAAVGDGEGTLSKANGCSKVEGVSSSDTSQSSTASTESDKLIMERMLSPRQSEASVREAIGEYERKLSNYQNALDGRDKLIEQMSGRLGEAVEERNRVQQVAGCLTKEIMSLREQLQKLALQQQQIQLKAEEAPHLASLEQALLEKEKQVENLQQTVEAQDREIEVLRHIRDDLLARITTEPVRDSLTRATNVDTGQDIPRTSSPSDAGLAEVSIGNEACDMEELATFRRLIMESLSSWADPRALRLENYEDVTAVLEDVKHFAIQGLQQSSTEERLKEAKADLEAMRCNIGKLQSEIEELQAELASSQEEVRRLRCANLALQQGSSKLDQEVKMLKRENNMMKAFKDSLSSIKEKAKEEVEEEKVLEVYGLQTECLRLELAKKELEQKTRLLSTSDHSPCVSPVPSSFAYDRTYGHSFTQTEVSVAATDERLRVVPKDPAEEDDLQLHVDYLKNEKASLQLTIQQLVSDLRRAMFSAEELRREKGAKDEVVLEKDRIALEKEELQLELQGLQERLQSSEATIKELRSQLKEERSSLEKFLAESENLSESLDKERFGTRPDLFAENQRLKCQLVLLKGQLETEVDTCTALRAQVLRMNQRDNLFQKAIKDLRNRLLSSSDESRKLQVRCRMTGQKLEKMAARVKYLERELCQLRSKLHCIRDEQRGKASHGDVPSLSSEGLPPDIGDYDSDIFDDEDETSSSAGTSEMLAEQLHPKGQELELLLKSQDLGTQASQEIHLCQLREELQKNYCDKLSATLEFVVGRCRQELLAFQQQLAAESSLQLLALGQGHKEDIMKLKADHKDQVDKLLSKFQPQVKAQEVSEKKEVIEELRAKQQAEYEDLLSCLDPEQKLKLQALVALTLKVHHVENEVTMVHTQMRMIAEKERILELLAASSQADKEVLAARLEYEKMSALKKQHESFLEQEKNLKGLEALSTWPPALSESGSAPWSTGSSVEGALQFLKDQLETEFYACADKLTGKWKEKYLSILNPATSGDGALCLLPEDESRGVAINLKKHLGDAEEAEELINTFFRLGCSLKEDVRSKLEQILHLYRDCFEESRRIADMNASFPRPDLELEALRTRLEEEHSRQATQLHSEHVAKMKELLEKHKRELEETRTSAEEQLAEERRAWSQELDILRNGFRKREEETLRRSQEKEAKISEEMCDLSAKHESTLAELEQEKRRVKELETKVEAFESAAKKVLGHLELHEMKETAGKTFPDILDVLLRAHQEAVEKYASLSLDHENAVKAASQFITDLDASEANVDSLMSIVERLIDTNVNLKEHLAATEKQYESKAVSLAHRLEEVENLYKAKIEQFLQNEGLLLANLKAKEEEQELLKHELQQYTDSMESLKADHASEIETLKNDLNVRHRELKLLEERRASEIDAAEKELEDALRRANEKHAENIKNLESRHRDELDQLRKEHDAELKKLEAKSQQELKELKMRCIALEDAVEGLKKERIQSNIGEGEEESSLLSQKRGDRGDSVMSTTARADLDEDSDYLQVPSLRIKKPAPEWSDLSMEDVLSERAELQRQVKYHKEAAERLQFEKKELQEALQKAKEQQSKEARVQSRSPRHTAQTNTRLLNVLSDLVKTYVDTEQDIQDALSRMGLSGHESPDSAAALEEEYPSLGATSQTHGSKEDFASGLADGFLSELCEDGPDLTPRTWDMFASAIGVQDLENEGEDVVLGASRRLRAAVDRVLKLLAEVAEHRGEDFRGLVQRNRDLCQELQEESRVHNQLSLDLLNAQASIRALEQEKQGLENKLATMEEECSKLNRELRLARAKIQRLEDCQETISEERRLLEEQRRILSSGLKEPQLKPCTPGGEEASDRPSEELLEENTKLMEEKNQLQKCQDEEKQILLLRIVELEGILEEAAAFKEQLLEERQHEVADLQAQIEGMDKQLQSNKKFIEEQIHEREQEREEFAQEIAQLHEIIREKEKIQNCEERLTKEIESLEQQIRLGIEERSVICRKRDQLEAEVRSRDDKIHDLREVIRELESEVGRKSRNEHDLLQKIANMEDALNVEENARSEVTSELEKMRESSLQPVASERIRQLEEQLESRIQELDKMTQFQSLLQEFRAQVRSLEEKVESRIQQQQDKHGSFRKFLETISSPEGSRDGATSGQSGASEDVEQHRALSMDDIRDLSPSGLQWDELRRLEDKVDTLVSASSELFKDNCRLQKQLKQLERAKKELEQEKLALQEEGQRQLLQISALKARMEDCRAGLGPGGGSPVSQQLHRLREELLRQKEAREDAEHRLQLSREQLSSLQTRVNAQPSLIGGIRDPPPASLQCHYGPTVFPLQAPVMDVDCETEISMEQLCKLEEMAAHVEELQKTVERLTKDVEEYRIKCAIQDNEIQSLNNYQDKPSGATGKESESGRRRLEKDFEEVQEILEEREEELCAAQKRSENQELLEAAVHKLQVDITDMQREHAKQMEEKETEAKEQEDSLKGHISRLRHMLEEQVEKHAQAQEAQRARIAALEEHLDKCIEREEVDSLINRAVTRERDALQQKYEEQLKQTEESWKSRLESERRRLEEEHLRLQAEMQEKYAGSVWSKNQLDKEIQSLLEQEKAVLNAQHLNALQNAKKAWEEETKALKSAHAEDIHCALEDLRISLLRIHTDEIEQLKQRLLTAAQEEKLAMQRQHDEEMKLLQHSWEQHVQLQMQNTVQRAHQADSPTQMQALVRQGMEQEVAKLQEMHSLEVAQLRKQIEQHEEQRLLQTKALEQELQRNNELLKRQQQCSAELAKVRSDAAATVREERKRMHAWAAEQLAAVEERIRRERAAFAEKVDAEKHRLGIEHDQEKRKMLEDHARQVAEMKAVHRQEVDNLRTELQRVRLRTRRAYLAESSRENTPPSDASSSEQTFNHSFDDSSQDSQAISPPLKQLLDKIYNDGLLVLSLTEKQLLRQHLNHSLGRFEPEGRNDKDFGFSGQGETEDQLRTSPWKAEELSPQRRPSNGQEADVLALKEQLNRSEWLSKTKCNMLEFQLKQEKMKAEELRKSLEEEVSKNIELLSQLNDQRSACLQTEMSLTSCRADLEDLKSKADHARKEALRFKSLYETEKVHTRNMLNACEVERSHFNQLRASLQSERKRGASAHERDQRTIKDLKDASLKWSPMSHQTTPRTTSRDVEVMRDMDRASFFSPITMGLDNSFHTVAPDTEGNHTVHLKCVREKDALNQSLYRLQEENCRLRSLLSNAECIKVDSIPTAFSNLLYKMYWKYRRTESWRKALAYQKQYLLSLLRGFQATEEVALQLLCRGRPPHPSGTSTKDASVPPLFRFRSAVRAVIAVHRMCNLVKKWKAAAIIPPTPLILHKAEQAVHGIPVGAPAGKPAHSSEAQQTPPSCVNSSGSPRTPHLRRGPLTFHRTAEDPAFDMGEYVTRLDQLHKKFGLDVP